MGAEIVSVLYMTFYYFLLLINHKYILILCYQFVYFACRLLSYQLLFPVQLQAWQLTKISLTNSTSEQPSIFLNNCTKLNSALVKATSNPWRGKGQHLCPE